MAVSFKIPKSPQKSILTIDEFKGVDFTNSPASVDDNKSPNAINMIRDVPGKVRKRMGYEVIEDYNDESSYVKNYCDISFNSYRAYRSFNYTYSGTQRTVITDNLTVTYNDADKTVTLNGWLNRYAVVKINNVDTRVPDVGLTTPEAYAISIPFTPPQGEYKITYFPISGSIVETKELQYGSYYTVLTSLDIRANNSGLFSIGSDDNEKQTETESYNGHTELTINIYAGNPLYKRYVEFNNLKIGINFIATDKYRDDLNYIPAGSNIPTDLKVNGCHYRRGDEHPVYHIGTNMIKNGISLYSTAKNALSHSWQFDDKLFIMDGKRFLIYDGTTIEPVENIAYIPLTYTDREPIHGEAGGGGKKVDDINLLQPQFTNEFIVTSDWSTAKQFPLSVKNLDEVPITVEVLDSNGEWQPKTVTTDYTVDYPTGIVTFVTAPGVTPIRGVPNVKITASKTTAGYADRINKCTFGTRFGVNGAFDRLFVSGNPDYPNSDWYSEEWDCSYFPDTSYSKLGSSKSAVVGYSIVSNYLAAHKDELEEDLSIIVREGDLVTNDSGIDKPSFRIINTLQGAGAIASNSFAYLCTEPLFLTRSGLYAVTAQDITGEKYAQSRSFYLNGKLTKEDFANLQNSFSVIYNDMYILCVNHDATDPYGNHYDASRLYILDGLQPMRTDKSEPYSTRQYAAFYCEMKNIHCMWERENRLYFGTSTGQVCRFYNDKEAQESYNDNGDVIICQWETPDIDGQLFYKNKSLRYIALRAGAAIATSVEIWGMDRGIWKFIKKDNTFGRYLSFEDIDFSKFSFSCDQTEQLSRTKVRIKKVDKYRLRFINNELNEPFVIYNIANEYIENGNYKG